jgi:hypothetical protein
MVEAVEVVATLSAAGEGVARKEGRCGRDRNRGERNGESFLEVVHRSWFLLFP